MKSLLAGASLLVLALSPAFAQSTQSTSSPAQSNTQANANSTGNLVAAQKIKDDLQKAGFTNVEIVAESFVVQAKSKDGDPVLMTIGPHGMSVFEAMNNNNSSGSGSSSTTGSSTGSATTPSSHK
jgi:opacity protein-like surface antigen